MPACTRGQHFFQPAQLPRYTAAVDTRGLFPKIGSSRKCPGYIRRVDPESPCYLSKELSSLSTRSRKSCPYAGSGCQTDRISCGWNYITFCSDPIVQRVFQCRSTQKYSINQNSIMGTRSLKRGLIAYRHDSVAIKVVSFDPAAYVQNSLLLHNINLMQGKQRFLHWVFSTKANL